MLRLGFISDVHGRDLEQALNDFNKEKVDAILFNGDIFESGNLQIDAFNLKKILTMSDKPSYFIPGSHENIDEYRLLIDAGINKAHEQVFDLFEKRIFDIKDFKIIGLPGTTWHPQNNEKPLIMDDELFTEFAVNLESVDLSKAVIMCHIPGYNLGDTAYFSLTNNGLIPGFIALSQYGLQALKVLKPQNALSKELTKGSFSELLTIKLQEKKPLAFVSGHIHENNAFESPGKDISTLGPVKQGELVKSLALSQGPYCKDHLESIYEQAGPLLREHGLELNSPWSNALGILTLNNEGASYKIRIIE